MKRRSFFLKLFTSTLAGAGAVLLASCGRYPRFPRAPKWEGEIVGGCVRFRTHWKRLRLWDHDWDWDTVRFDPGSQLWMGKVRQIPSTWFMWEMSWPEVTEFYEAHFNDPKWAALNRDRSRQMYSERIGRWATDDDIRKVQRNFLEGNPTPYSV